MPNQWRIDDRRAFRAALIAILFAASSAEVFADGPNPAAKNAARKPAPVDPTPATLSGRVRDESDKPLSDVRIELALTNVSGVTRQLFTKSTAGGNYRLELPQLLETNSFYLVATRPGYQRWFRVSGPGGTLADLKPGAQLKVNLFLNPGLYVTGIAVDERGKPIQGARVVADAVTVDGRQFKFWETATQQDGFFELFDFPERQEKIELQDTRWRVSCSHRDYVAVTIPDVHALAPQRRTALRIVLKSGHAVSGVVLDAANNPVPRVTVKALDPSENCLKLATANAAGEFQIHGLPDGQISLTIVAGQIKQKARVPLVLASDRRDLKISLQPIPLPKDLKTYRVLGMELADITPELQSTYELDTDRGVLVLACGKRSHPLQHPGKIPPGCLLSEIETGDANSVRDVIKSIIALTANQKPDDRLVVVTHVVKDPVPSELFTTFKLTDADFQELRKALSECAADDQEAVLALCKLGAQLRFKAAKSANPSPDVAGPDLERVILGDKWKGTDRDLRLAWYLPLSNFLVRGRGHVSDQALEELRQRRPDLNVDRISDAYLGAQFVPEAGNLQVAAIHGNSPATRAGFAEKDVLIEFAGKPVSDFRALRALTFTLKPGQKVAAKLMRQGKPVTVTVEMGSWD